MTEINLSDLQTSVQDTKKFHSLRDYYQIGKDFLHLIESIQPTRIVSPTHPHYIYYQYNQSYGYKITRPINTKLFIEDARKFDQAFQRFTAFLSDLKQYRNTILDRENTRKYVETAEINSVIYTIQQSIGCVADSFSNSNQSRKRVGQLFEGLVQRVIQEVGLQCEPRTINIPIPGFPDYEMSYELDLVFSQNKAILTAENRIIHSAEVVGSVKTTSKDRIDKIFLDKYLLTKLLGREVPVIAIFLHDVQRAKAGNSIFGINSTFKSNHFLGYSVALSRLDGVYYVDLPPRVINDPQFQDQIEDFQTFLVADLWKLSE